MTDKKNRKKPNISVAELQADKQRVAAEKAARRAQRAAERTAKHNRKRELMLKKAEVAEAKRKKRKAVYVKIRQKLNNRAEGFDHRNSGILPRVELSVRGDRTSVATGLAAAGVTLRDIKCASGETLFKIRKKDLPKAVAILNEMCYTYKINATFGIGKSLAFLAARCGLIIGVAASVAVLNIAYGYVWQVKIDGNIELSSAAIEAALKRANVAVGCKKSEPIAARVAGSLGDMDGIADASCEIVGTTLYVHVLESKEYKDRKTHGEYRAKYDARVTRVVMRSGSALVKRGDVVARGDTLANGDVYSTAGELLYTAECDAEIYGEVSLTFGAQLSTAAVEYKRTGKTAEKTVFTLFGKQLGKAKPPFRSCDMTSSTSSFDVLIPLYSTTYRYYETKAVEYERDINEAAELFARSKIEELGFVGDFDYSYNVTQSLGGLYSVHLFLTGETLISEGMDRQSVNNGYGDT